jgi:diacylglycerol O-acyltransferase
VKQLSAQDASFLYFETANAPMHIASLSIYDQSTAPGGLVTLKQIMANVEARLDLGYAFRRKVKRVPFDWDHPYWVDDPDFDLEFHVRHIALPKPGDWRQLCIQAARLHSRVLDVARPLWELYVIEGLDNVEGVPPGAFALMLKIHHAAVDGVSGTELIAALHDLVADTPLPEEKAWVPKSEPSDSELLVRAGVNSFMQPFRFAELQTRAAPALARASQRAAQDRSAAPPPVPRTRFNSTVSVHRVFDGIRIPLAGLRSVKSVVPEATVNDAVLSVVGGALRSYLASKGELPAEPLQAMAPISVRSEDAKAEQGNQVAAMVVSLATTVEDPLDRLRAVHASTTAQKEMTNAVGARLMTDYNEFIPSAVAALAARQYTELGLANQANPAFNCVVSNVPGPRVPLYMCGSRLVIQYGMGPIQDGMGLIHGVFSYDGQVALTATSCRAMMPDPGFYAECLSQSYQDLIEATGYSAAPSKSSPARRPTAKKATARSAAAKKTAAKKTTARKTAAKKTGGRKAAAKKSATKR